MQKFTYLFLLLFLSVFSANAQFKVLFVDDSGDAFGNAEYLASTLDSLGYENLYVDAIGQNVTPSLEDMNAYDLVIWHTSSWGAGLQLWGGGDSTNAVLKAYLSQPEANLWLIGLDFMYDRYGSAPVTFQAGEFPYDYLGIAKYASQSYADDGGLGVPVVNPAPGQPITGITDINWVFSTLWYADGFELRPEATPVYLFGDAGYALSGAPSAAFYQVPGGARVLTYGFDLSLAANFGLMRSHVGTVLNWWEAQVSGVHTPAVNPTTVTITPNIVTNGADIRVKSTQNTSISVRIFDSMGQLVTVLADQEVTDAGVEKVIRWDAATTLPAGVYYCSVQAGGAVKTSKLVKI